jgi:DNA uptake protein ComE-like DNA-binding protein
MRSLARAALIALAVTLGAPAAPLLSTPVAAQAALIDINTASKEALEALKGVGPVRADAIIKGRPYKGKDDLLHKKIVPQNVYDDIKDKIVARQKS